MKRQATDRKYLQNTCLTKDLYSKYTENPLSKLMFENDNVLYKYTFLFITHIFFDYKIMHNHHRQHKNERKG